MEIQKLKHVSNHLKHLNQEQAYLFLSNFKGLNSKLINIIVKSKDKNLYYNQKPIEMYQRRMRLQQIRILPLLQD